MNSGMTPRSENEWTWRDSVNRLQHIDGVISEIVRDGITILLGFLAAVTVTIVTYSTREFMHEFDIIVFLLILLLCLTGMIIAHDIVKNLSRQEYQRQWIFHKIKEYEKMASLSIPLMPPDKVDTWINEDEWIKPDRKEICLYGKGSTGYCIRWIYLFRYIYYIFFLTNICANWKILDKVWHNSPILLGVFDPLSSQLIIILFVLSTDVFVFCVIITDHDKEYHCDLNNTKEEHGVLEKACCFFCNRFPIRRIWKRRAEYPISNLWRFRKTNPPEKKTSSNILNNLLLVITSLAILGTIMALTFYFSRALTVVL